jgi:hypothetical protein
LIQHDVIRATIGVIVDRHHVARLELNQFEKPFERDIGVSQEPPLIAKTPDPLDILGVLNEPDLKRIA